MAYIACPKCNHEPLPENQDFPAACPSCGVIFAKIDKRVPRVIVQPANTVEATLPLDAPEASKHQGVVAMVFHVPDQVNRLNWYSRISLLAVFVLWTFFIWRDMDIPSGDAGSGLLHLILTPFHEAGHYLIFRWFGQFIMILGGTMGQHLFAIVLSGALLWKRRDPFGAAVFLWVLGFSVSDMGVYMFDAFDPKLMLLDGRTGMDSDGHDWQNIFGDLGLLKHARGIGIFFGGLGKMIMVAGLAWAAWIIWLQKARLSDSPIAEISPE